jgi:hypothetical protein
MPQAPSRTPTAVSRPVVALPDLEHTRAAVLNSLSSASGQRTYDHAIREFIAWYGSEPRLAFNRAVVLRYRIHFEQRHYAPATINLRLAAVRRVANEAADARVLSPELAAGIRRVKGVRRIGVRLGNWLTPEQGKRLLQHSTGPVDWRVAEQHAQLPFSCAGGVHRADGFEESLVGPTLIRDGCVLPGGTDGLQRNVVTPSVPIHQILIACVSHFDHDVVDRVGESRVTDQRPQECLRLVVAMSVTQGDKIVCSQCFSDRGDWLLRLRRTLRGVNASRDGYETAKKACRVACEHSLHTGW